MLDNIVTDGMRVAVEVRRRMDDAQKELDRGAATRGTEDEEDEEGEDHAGDLLEGAEADAGGGGTKVEHGDPSLLDMNKSGEGPSVTSDAASGKSMMFER